MKSKILSNLLLDAIGQIDDAYVISAQNRITGTAPEASQKTSPRILRFVPRKAAFAAAAIVVLLFSSFTVAMAANEDFRAAVFRFFKITVPDTVLPPESEPAQTDPKAEAIGSTNLEGVVDVEYIRIDSTFDYNDGIVYLYEPWDGYNDEYDAMARYSSSAYTVENGQLAALEPHYESITYHWDGEDIQIDFDWYEKDGIVYTNAKNYDPFVSVQWDITAAKGNSGFLILTLGFGQQIEYTQRPLLYNLRTKELLDVLSGCSLPEEQRITETEFSPDLSKLLITCNGDETVYYYDITKNALHNLDTLCEMEEPAAWFLDDATLCCISVNEEGRYSCGTLKMPSGTYSRLFSAMPRPGQSSDSGIVLTGGRYGLIVNHDSTTSVYDFMTGESAPIDGFCYSADYGFMTANSTGNKILYICNDPEADGLGIAEMGVLDLETRTFLLFDREGYEVRREDTVGWFDNDRVAIRASAGEYGYLYLITATF